MEPSGSTSLFAALAAILIVGPACERSIRGPDKGDQVIIQTLPDPSGRLVAIVDRVEYANGLLTSVADRVRVVEAASMNAEGTLVFSEDALPDNERPTVSWSGGRLLISISRNAAVIHREPLAGGIEVVVSPR